MTSIKRIFSLLVCVFLIMACTPGSQIGGDENGDNNTEQVPDGGDNSENEGGNTEGGGNEGGEGNEGEGGNTEGGEGNEGEGGNTEGGEGNEGEGEEPKPEEPKPEEPKPEEPKPALRVSVIGDSISTFDGYIGGNRAYYPAYTVTDVSQTYWHKLIYKYMSNATLDTNIAWSGSYVSRCTDSNHSDKHYYTKDFCARVKSTGLGNPDIILVHGGTNDSGNGDGWVTLYNNYSIAGTAIPSDSEFASVFATAAAATTLDAAYALDDTSFVTAYVKLMRIFQLRYPKAKVVLLIGDYVGESCRKSTIKIANHYNKVSGYQLVDFQVISPYKENKVITKVSGSHPDENGFEVMANYIYQQAGKYLELPIVQDPSQLTDVTEREGDWN